MPRWLFLNIPTWEEWRQAGARASVINSLFPIVSSYTGAALPHSECHWVISNDYQKVPIHTFLQNLSVWTLEELITTYIGLLYQVDLIVSYTWIDCKSTFSVRISEQKINFLVHLTKLTKKGFNLDSTGFCSFSSGELLLMAR